MPQRLKIIDLERCIGCNLCVFACARTNYRALSMDRSAITVKTRGGMSSGFVVIICKGCDSPDGPVCTRVCPTGALTPRKGGGCRLDPALCNGCGACKDACTLGAIRLDNETSKPLICIHCGMCVKYCPHKVIGMEQIN